MSTFCFCPFYLWQTFTEFLLLWITGSMRESLELKKNHKNKPNPNKKPTPPLIILHLKTGISHFLIHKVEQRILAKHKHQNPWTSQKGEGSCKSPWQRQRQKQLCQERWQPQNVHSLQVLLTVMYALCFTTSIFAEFVVLLMKVPEEM